MSHANISFAGRTKIVLLHESGLNISEIAEEMGISRLTARRWIRRQQAEGFLEHRSRLARVSTSKIQASQVSYMTAILEEHPFTPLRRFAEELDCTSQTVRNALHRAGYHNRKPATKILLREDQKAARVEFARAYRDFDFSHAIFSDEKSFKSSETGRRHLWRVNNTRYEPRNILPNTESGRIVVNMWAWMSAAGLGELVYIPERSTGATYVRVLDESMLPTVRVVYPETEIPELSLSRTIAPYTALT